MATATTECPVCFETSNEMVTCPNGHSFCEQCVLRRIKSVYEEGRSCFMNKDFSDKEDSEQKCFVCRTQLLLEM